MKQSKKNYRFYIYHRGAYSTIVKGWLPNGHEELGQMLDKLARKNSKHLADIEHVGWSEDTGKGDLSYEGIFACTQDAKNFCRYANIKIAEYLKN